MFDFQYLHLYRKLPAKEKLGHLTTVLVLVAVVRLGFMVIMMFYSNIFRSDPAENKYIAEGVQKLSAKTEALFVGTSHFKFGIRPSHFSHEVMNLAANGLDYRSSEKVIQANIGKVENLKVFCIEYDDVPFVVSTVKDVQGNFDFFYKLGLSRRQILGDDLGEGMRAFSDELLYDVFYPVNRLPRMTPQALFYFMGVNEHLDPNLARVREEEALRSARDAEKNHSGDGVEPGFVGVKRDLIQKSEIKVAKDRFSQITHFMVRSGGANTQRQIRALEGAIDFLKSRDIKVVLLRLPHPPVYWQYRPADMQARFTALESGIHSRYSADIQSKAVSIWDLGKEPSFVREDFFDSDHINEKGANKLAPILDKRLGELLQRK